MPVTASRCAFIEIHLVALGLAAELGEGVPLLRYLGAIEGPADLSATVDRTVYGAGRSRRQRAAHCSRQSRRPPSFLGHAPDHRGSATRGKIAVPDLVVGEAFKKLRYYRRVSPRKDAGIALTVFG